MFSDKFEWNKRSMLHECRGADVATERTVNGTVWRADGLGNTATPSRSPRGVPDAMTRCTIMVREQRNPISPQSPPRQLTTSYIRTLRCAAHACQLSFGHRRTCCPDGASAVLCAVA